jgi:MFS family permease
MAARRLTSPFWLTLLLCLGEVLMMRGVSVYPGLLPEFQALWGLSNGEAGWVGGIFYAGYVLMVPPLVALTDVQDPRPATPRHWCSSWACPPRCWATSWRTATDASG